MGNSQLKDETQDFGSITKQLTEYLCLNNKDLKQVLIKKKTLRSTLTKSNLTNNLCCFDVLDLTMKITENISTNNNDLHFLNTSLLHCNFTNSIDNEGNHISLQNNLLNQVISGEDVFKNNNSPASKKENISIKLEDTNNNKKENVSIKLEDTSNNKNISIKLDESLRSSKLLQINSLKKQDIKFDPRNKYNNLSQIQESAIRHKKEDYKTPDTSHDNTSIIIKNLDTIKINSNDLINNKSKNNITQQKQKKHIISGKPISISPYKKKKKTNKITKPAVVNIKVDLRDIQRENVIESYLNRSRINNSISPNKVNNYTTKSKSPDPRDSSFKVFIDRCTHANDISNISTKDSNVFEKKSERKTYLNNSNTSNFKKTYTQRSINKTSWENSHVDNSISSYVKPSFTKRETFGMDQRSVKKKDELEEKKPNIANLYREMKKLNIQNKENEEKEENILKDKEKSPFELEKNEGSNYSKATDKRTGENANQTATEKRASNNKIEVVNEEIKSYSQKEAENDNRKNMYECKIEKMEISLSPSTPLEDNERKNSYRKPIITEIKAPIYENKVSEEKSENKRYQEKQRYQEKEQSHIYIEALENNINSKICFENEDKKDVYSKFKLSENLKKRDNLQEDKGNQGKSKVSKKTNAKEDEEEDEEEDEIMKYYRQKNKSIRRNNLDEEEEEEESTNNINQSVNDKEDEEEDDSYKFKSNNKIIYKNNNKKSKELYINAESKRKPKVENDKYSEYNEESLNSLKNKGRILVDKKNKVSNLIGIKKKQIYTSKHVDDNDFLNF